MTKDIWDERPKERNEKYKDRYYDDFYRFRYDAYINDLHLWIARVKVELDKMQKKAEKWDKLVEEDPDATIIISEVFEEAIEDLNRERDRVDAIRKYCEKALAETEDFPERKVEVRKLLRLILKFLEDAGQ